MTWPNLAVLVFWLIILASGIGSLIVLKRIPQPLGEADKLAKARLRRWTSGIVVAIFLDDC